MSSRSDMIAPNVMLIVGDISGETNIAATIFEAGISYLINGRCGKFRHKKLPLFSIKPSAASELSLSGARRELLIATQNDNSNGIFTRL